MRQRWAAAAAPEQHDAASTPSSMPSSRIPGKALAEAIRQTTGSLQRRSGLGPRSSRAPRLPASLRTRPSPASHASRPSTASTRASFASYTRMKMCPTPILCIVSQSPSTSPAASAACASRAGHLRAAQPRARRGGAPAVRDGGRYLHAGAAETEGHAWWYGRLGLEPAPNLTRVPSAARSCWPTHSSTSGGAAAAAVGRAQNGCIEACATLARSNRQRTRRSSGGASTSTASPPPRQTPPLRCASHSHLAGGSSSTSTRRSSAWRPCTNAPSATSARFSSRPTRAPAAVERLRAPAWRCRLHGHPIPSHANGPSSQHTTGGHGATCYRLLLYQLAFV